MIFCVDGEMISEIFEIFYFWSFEVVGLSQECEGRSVECRLLETISLTFTKIVHIRQIWKDL